MATISKTRNTSKEGPIGKKRRPGYSESDDNASKVPYGKKNCELPFSKRYNNSFKSHLPAELFRKDLISAMKLADNEQLSPDDYWLISDTWKQEWEKGVQVPVNPDGLPESNVRVLFEKKKPSDPKNEFKLPKKLLKFSEDKNYSPDIHVLTNAPARYLKVCSYDLDIVDIEWLKIMNEELKLIGLPCLTESAMELAMEKIENQCFCKLQEAIKTEEGLGIEFDDDVICDVCRSPDSEEGNEMVFCDACNVCVHQACYGITKIPEGSWICRSCALGIQPSCTLCPNTGGAMKSTRSGKKWTHVSCALWIPEVAIENVDRMEPITKISDIPASRWALVCSLCREKVGACIQCSVRTCKTAYHVTCAFQHGLAMKAIIDDDEEEDDVDLKSYCLKHTKEKKGKASEELNEQPNKKKNKKELEMSNEEKASARLARIKQMEAEFYRYVNIRDIARSLKMDINVVDFIYQYWILKRKANFNKPLVIPKSKPLEPVENNPLNSLYARMKMFVHLRQDLERVRNLCYMVTKRERLSRSWCKIKHDIFLKQAEIVSNDSFNCKEAEKQAILNANHGDTIYDIMSSCDSSPKPSLNSVLSALGEKSHTRKEDSVIPKHRKLSTSSSSPSSLQRLPNPYAKQYSNSVVKRSQRLSTESYTEQDAKWKEMSENQKASRQKSKDIANKLAALQETYNLKPMEIVVDKLPDQGPSLQFSRFSKRTNVLSGKRRNRSSGSPEKLHSEPLNKRPKIHLSLRAKSTKHSSRTEAKDHISSDTNSAQLPQESVHNSHDHQTDLGNLTNLSEENEFNNNKKQIQVNSGNSIQNEFQLNNEKSDILCEEQISEIYYHQTEHSYVNHEEGKDWEGYHFDSEKEVNGSSEAGKNSLDNDANESCPDDDNDDEEHLVMESTDVQQKEQRYSSVQEKVIVTNMTDCKISEINAHDNNYNVCSNYTNEIGINHKKENGHHQNETTNLSVEQAQKENFISAIDHKNEVTEHINPNKSLSGTDAANDEENVVQMVYMNNMVKEGETNHRKGDEDNIVVYINNIVKESESNQKKVDSKVREKEENEKHSNFDIIKDCQEEKVNSTKNYLYHHSKIEKIENNDKFKTEVSNCSEYGNKTGGHKEQDEIEVNNHKRWEAEVSNYKKVENQYHYYKKEHEILKDVKVSVQRYNSENMEEKRSANTRFSNNESSMNSSVKAENENSLHERCEKSVAENGKDVSFHSSSKSFQNDCVQESLSRRSEIHEVQILKKSSLNQEARKSGNVINSRKILNYEQRLMNSKKLRKEDIIIPARPYVENSKQQKLTERNKLHRDGSKPSKKEFLHKKPARLNKSLSLIKNMEKNSNLRCIEGERTLCRKPENNLSTAKQHNRFAKDISRYTDKEMETQKINSKDKSQEKLVSETIARENLNTENLKEAHCKDIHSKNTSARYSSSLNFSSSELLNKKLSPKPNMHKYHNVPEKLQCSPSSNNAHSPSTVSPTKDVASGKEKLRQESAKIRESLFSVSTCTSKSLSGYKIPKKSRTDSAEKTSVQSSQDTTKLSPLYGVCQIQQTETYPHNGYHTDRNFRGCKYNSRVRNGEQYTQESKLLLKLSKGSNYSNTARWKNDSVPNSRRDSFCLKQNNNTFPSLSRNPHCDRSCVSTDSVMLPVASDAGGYWVSEDSSGNFIKHFTQNVQNGDYGLS